MRSISQNKEAAWDQRLQIRTVGRDESNADEYRYPYEPTPYCVLERLADFGLIRAGDTLLDYGCGKGRVGFFLGEQRKIQTIGIEYDARIYQAALQNQKTAQARAEFVPKRAEQYKVPPSVDHCYFFNPFSVEILRKVMGKILASWYEAPREMFLFFYYPSDEYVSYLMTVEELDFYDEIECEDLFQGKDPRERISIFQLGGEYHEMSEMRR